MDRKKELYASAIRSREMIKMSLIQLMKVKRFEDITISEITKNADLVRRTFYGHYKSKTDVLESYIEDKSYTFLDDNYQKIRNDLLTLSELYFSLWYKNLDFLLLLYENDLLLLVKPKEVFISHVEDKLELCAEYDCSVQAAKFANTFYTGAMWNILVKWIETGMVESVKELGEVFAELVGWE